MSLTGSGRRCRLGVGYRQTRQVVDNKRTGLSGFIEEAITYPSPRPRCGRSARAEAVSETARDPLTRPPSAVTLSPKRGRGLSKNSPEGFRNVELIGLVAPQFLLCYTYMFFTIVPRLFGEATARFCFDLNPPSGGTQNETRFGGNDVFFLHHSWN